jgi:A/G-specific adenine glycosylase
MSAFSTKIIAWQKRAGRHDLPWQQTQDSYRIWLSEIMLQQTQVAAVVPYYHRFLQRFPDVATLAAASQDEVMPYWAGLGYYARARNLHRAANEIVSTHGGIFPREFAAIHALPGIGRSTAAAISAFAFGERQGILDGNVKRVFARHFAVEGDVKSKAVSDALWKIAEANLPRSGIENYTQGLMDLGATLCIRRAPSCVSCPVIKSCVGFREGRVEALPGKSEKRTVPRRQTRMLIIRKGQDVLLERRPSTGIWGGLWSFPELTIDADIAQTLLTRYGFNIREMQDLPPIEHGFTHFSLTIFPVEIVPTKISLRAMEPGVIWLSLEDALTAAIPAPVKRIVISLSGTSN